MELRKLKIKRSSYQSDTVWISVDAFKKANIKVKYNECIQLTNIRCLDKKEKATVSWYHHDVFRKLTHVYIDVETLNDEYGPVYYLESTKLYSKTKLKKLSKSESFKQKRFAFFSYDFVNHLLGLPTDLDFGVTYINRI